MNSLTDRFWAKVTKHPEPLNSIDFHNTPPETLDLLTPEEKGCWVWNAYTTNGYGQFGRNERAHRFSYKTTNGPIPEGFVLDHLCRCRKCVNPDHLEPVLLSVNVLRGVSVAALHARKTHCDYGHEFTPENTYTPATGIGRYCRACRARHQHEMKDRIDPNRKRKGLRGPRYRKSIPEASEA